ncbi:ABC transporter ATP-binding protein [Oceanobacillus rekensis]|uniref:ABC transporter ATP-binding protein n=1 Tax=Oceanobacillus rekensis TaxID=937927 RepID=UPI000B43F84D|nr:ABC transporter ATP-binding protein [Oceanobacillus rekensis]
MYLTLDGVEKKFQSNTNNEVKVLDDISFEVEKGQFVSIVGPSGCGKSTLLYLVSGLEKASKGKIEISGEQVTKPGPDRVVVFQEDGLFPWLNVLDNVTYGLLLKKMPKKEAEAKATEMLKLVHLSNYADSYPHQLSGGMKHRVAIARALVMDPDILLMDEPFAALDEQTRMALHNELLEIWRKTKVTVLFVTHNIREAVLLSQKIIVMATRPGKIKATYHVQTTQDGYTPDSVTLDLEQKILATLEEEMEKVLKEELGDDYNFKKSDIHRDTNGDMGSGI